VLYAIGVIVFAIGLLASIALHEAGHMLPAKKFGVKVPQYMVGFGPTIWSRTKGETEYGVKAIPAGGYVRMIGMVPPAKADGRRSRWPRRMADMVNTFREQNRAGIDPQDESREFYRLTPGKKMIVMLSGPCVNLLIFLVLMVGLLAVVGVAHDDPTTTVASVSRCVVPANATQQQVDACTQTNSPAALAGFKAGDRFVSVDGVPAKSWDQVVAKVEASAGRRLTIVVDRDGRELTLTPTPVQNRKYVSDTGDATKVAGFLGLSPTNHHYYSPMSFSKIPSEIGSELGRGFSALGSYPKKISNLWQTVFDGKPRDPEGAIGVVGIGRIGGEIAETNQFDLQDKIVMLVSLLASVNLLLFFFNLIPLLPLDGGHVAGAIVEAARRGWARVRGRSARIFVDTSTMLPITYAVTLVLVAMTLLTLYADIAHPVELFG